MKRNVLLLLLGVGLTTVVANASVITLNGVIVQSPADGGATPSANPSLMNVADGDKYAVVLNFTGSLAVPNTFSITRASFTDTTAGVSESAFITTGSSFTVTAAGAANQFSALACLLNCATGNQLALVFSIPAALLTGTGVTASAVTPFLPMDLLEDDGSTDIHGSVTQYSYTGAGGPPPPAPEPASVGLTLAGLAMLGLAAKKKAAAR